MDTHTHTLIKMTHVLTPKHRHRSTWMRPYARRRAHTRPHILTHTYPFGFMCPDAHNRTQTHACAHGCTLLLGSHGQRGPGEPAQQDDSPTPVPVSWAAAGQPSSSGSDRRAHHCWEEALAASRALSPCRSGAQPCPSGADGGVWGSPFLPWCFFLGWAALPWSRTRALLSSRGPVLPCCSRVQGRSAVCVPGVSSICPDLLGSQPAHLCM